MFHNSTSNSRGVGILISNNLQYTVNAEYRDIANNVLALSITVCDTDVLLISVYGPNNNRKEFYLFLHSVLAKFNNVPTICAGDWNATYSTDPGDSNIDVINMSCPPSCIRSGWLAELCDEFNLSDPYRAINHNIKKILRMYRVPELKINQDWIFFWFRTIYYTYVTSVIYPLLSPQNFSIIKVFHFISISQLNRKITLLIPRLLLILDSKR
jgi:hypothetical protein